MNPETFVMVALSLFCQFSKENPSSFHYETNRQLFYLVTENQTLRTMLVKKDHARKRFMDEIQGPERGPNQCFGSVFF